MPLKSRITLIMAVFLILLTSPLAAQEVAATVSGSLIVQSEWFVPIGLRFGVDLEWGLTDHWMLGGHAGYFDAGSSSSDHASYDREILSGYAAGPQMRYRFRPNKTIDPYVSGRLSLMYGARGYHYEKTEHLTIAPGIGVGVDFWLGRFRAGVFYEADMPLSSFDDFGGILYTLYFPGVRLGIAF